MSVYDSLQPNNIGNAIMQSFQQGQQQAKQRATDNAMTQYALNPDDPKVIEGLTRSDPRLAIQVRHEQQGRQQQVAKADLQRRAVQGDPAALAELAGIDLDAWAKIGDQDKGKIKQRVDFMGNAALAISQLPEQQRAQAWDAYIEQGIQQGYGDLAQYRGRYSPDGLNAALAQSGMVSKFLDSQKIDWKVIPEGGRITPFSQQGQPLDPQGLGAPAPAGVTFTPINGGPTPQASGGFPY